MIPYTTQIVNLISMPLEPIFTRLGGREKPPVQAEILAKYQSGIESLVNETRVRIFYLEQPWHIQKEELAMGDYVFTSRLLKTRYQAAQSVLVMGASTLAEDFDKIQHWLEAGEMQAAVILDAVLSEKTDFALDFIQQKISVELYRMGRTYGQRLSCGYGDFELIHQHFFYKILRMAEHGIRISEQAILAPEKTVTALLPIYGENSHDH